MIAHSVSAPDARALLADAKNPPKLGGIDPLISRKVSAEQKATEEEARLEMQVRGEAETADLPSPIRNLNICHNCGEAITGKLAAHSCPSSAGPQAE